MSPVHLLLPFTSYSLEESPNIWEGSLIEFFSTAAVYFCLFCVFFFLTENIRIFFFGFALKYNYSQLLKMARIVICLPDRSMSTSISMSMFILYIALR